MHNLEIFLINTVLVGIDIDLVVGASISRYVGLKIST